MESVHKCMLNDFLRKKRKSKTQKPEYSVFLPYGPTHGVDKTLERRHQLCLPETALWILLP